MDNTTCAWWVVVVIMAAACIAFLANAVALGAVFLLVALPAIALADVLFLRRLRSRNRR